MSDESVYAVFEPSEAKLLSAAPQSQLLVENPLLASALSNIFPYLLFIDNFLEIVTWTNSDPYLNFLLVVAYSVLVWYWHLLKLWVLPLLLALVFSSVVWNTSSVLYDAKFGEKPTIDEVLLTLSNITARFELLLRPAKHVDLNSRNYVKMLVGAILLTPVHWATVRLVFLPPTYTWAVGVVALTYHSPFSFATRRLLWRSAYLRKALHYLTGSNIRLARSGRQLSTRAHSTISRTHSPGSSDTEELGAEKVQMINNFTVLKKVIVSKTQLKQTVRFAVLENERRWLGLGWSKYLLPNERASYCFATLMLLAPDPHSEEPFEFPVFENDLYTYQWQWMDDKWELDFEFNRGRFKSGWVYYDKNWLGQTYEDGFTRYTRSRKWTRRAVLLIDKRAEVYDG